MVFTERFSRVGAPRCASLRTRRRVHRFSSSRSVDRVRDRALLAKEPLVVNGAHGKLTGVVEAELGLEKGISRNISELTLNTQLGIFDALSCSQATPPPMTSV